MGLPNIDKRLHGQKENSHKPTKPFVRVTGRAGDNRRRCKPTGRGKPMKGKPLLVAVAAFVIVLIGGAAMAGIGIQRDASTETSSSYRSADSEATLDEETPKPTSTTSTVAKEEEHSEEAREEAREKAKVDTEEKEDSEESEDHEGEAKTEAEETPDPAFRIKHPAEGTHVKSKVLAFGGTHGEGTTVHRGKYTASHQGGEWSMELVLSPGKNRVAFKGINGEGESVVASVTVYFDAPAKETDDEKEEEKPQDEKAIFQAHQKYGSCGEEVPYDVFYGSAKPGAKISALSEYGSNSTTANDDGRWEMKVEFPDAPSGKTFTVKIRASTGEYQKFSFTNTGGGEDH